MYESKVYSVKNLGHKLARKTCAPDLIAPVKKVYRKACHGLFQVPALVNIKPRVFSLTVIFL